jgi:alkylation response protein AidB-like acyl-CoA dehydrogenase
MSGEQLVRRLRGLVAEPMPLPGAGDTPLRHRRLIAAGREDLSLARLAEAHWDAVAILAEAGRQPAPGALYGVWASQIPGQALRLEPAARGFRLHGTKRFLSGAGLVDRALVTAGEPEPQLVDLDLRRLPDQIAFDHSAWKVKAFAETRTAAAVFTDVPVAPEQLVGDPGWYLSRIGFWHGACGPAACWAGGAAGLLDAALAQPRADPHTLAHLGTISAAVWGLNAIFETAGREIDRTDKGDDNTRSAHARALTVRHLTEQSCTEVLRRFARAYGPAPLAMDEAVADRYQELDLYLRQCHAERDLEALGRLQIAWKPEP